MDDGLNIRWRQTAPDRSLLALAMDELRALHTQWPGTKQCDVVVERAATFSGMYRVSVEIDFGAVARARGEHAGAEAVAHDVTLALRQAFQRLKRPGKRRATQTKQRVAAAA